LEKSRKSIDYFKSFTARITAYKAIDPIVFSLDAGYRVNLHRKEGNRSIVTCNQLFLNPSVAFAANDRVTLATGFQWISRQTDHYHGTPAGFQRTSTALQLGVGYGFFDATVLNVGLTDNLSGGGGSESNRNWQYTF